MNTNSTVTVGPTDATPETPYTSSAGVRWTLVVVNAVIGAGLGLVLGLIVGLGTGLIPFSC